MDIILGMLVTFCILILSINKGVFVGIPLLIGFFIFAFIACRKGFSLKDILIMSYSGGKKAFVVLEIFILIGAITAIWMASGTVPGIVYYGIQLMNAELFILYAFLISSLVSFLLGTSLGTVSTVGLALIVLAKSGNVDTNVAAGAIIAGAYFGDRCSPMSSSANLVAKLTGTNLYTNIRELFKTSVIPFILSAILYAVISSKHTLNVADGNMNAELINIFNINWIVLLPSIIIIIFSLLKVSVKTSMCFSILAASLISISLQGYSFIEVLRYLFLGFRLDLASPLYTIIKGGGIISMWKASLIIFISCALAGIFEGTNMLKKVEDLLMKAKTRSQLFSYTTVVSIITAAFGCNQSIATVLTNQLMTKPYKARNIDNHTLAIDLEDTSIILSALIPWNIAAFIPTTTMDVSSSGFIPYAFYLYLIPIINILSFKLLEKNSKKT